MKPQGILTEQDYQKLASELIDYHDPDNFLDNCERKYMATNRNFYKHLLKAVSGFIFPESELRRTDMPIFPRPDNAKTEKAVEIVKRRGILANQIPPTDFDIGNLQFVLNTERHKVEIQPGKHLHLVCCGQTMTCLQGLVPYNPNERDFALFARVFSNPHILRLGVTLPQIINDEEKVDYFFQLVERNARELSRKDLVEYFFRCVEIDINWDFHKLTTGKTRFLIMKFTERMEDAKRNLLFQNDTENPPEEISEMPNPNFTTARQVLAVLYLLEYCQVKEVDKTQIARFIEFLTGKNYDNIYKAVRSPLASKVGNFRREDLQFIRHFFENLGLVEIVKMINNQLDKIDK